MKTSLRTYLLNTSYLTHLINQQQSLDLKAAPSRVFSPPPLSLSVDAVVLGTAYTLCHSTSKKHKQKPNFKDTVPFKYIGVIWAFHMLVIRGAGFVFVVVLY